MIWKLKYRLNLCDDSSNGIKKFKVFTFINTKKKVFYLLKTMLILNKINFFTKFKWRILYKHHGRKITHRRKTIE